MKVFETYLKLVVSAAICLCLFIACSKDKVAPVSVNLVPEKKIDSVPDTLEVPEQGITFEREKHIPTQITALSSQETDQVKQFNSQILDMVYIYNFISRHGKRGNRERFDDQIQMAKGLLADYEERVLSLDASSDSEKIVRLEEFIRETKEWIARITHDYANTGVVFKAGLTHIANLTGMDASTVESQIAQIREACDEDQLRPIDGQLFYLFTDNRKIADKIKAVSTVLEETVISSKPNCPIKNIRSLQIVKSTVTDESDRSLKTKRIFELELQDTKFDKLFMGFRGFKVEAAKGSDLKDFSETSNASFEYENYGPSDNLGYVKFFVAQRAQAFVLSNVIFYEKTTAKIRETVDAPKLSIVMGSRVGGGPMLSLDVRFETFEDGRDRFREVTFNTRDLLKGLEVGEGSYPLNSIEIKNNPMVNLSLELKKTIFSSFFVVSMRSGLTHYFDDDFYFNFYSKDQHR